jgi:hypothetical protein
MDNYLFVVIIASYVFFIWVARKIAINKGLDPTLYFALALLLTPLIGIVAALVAKPKTVL